MKETKITHPRVVSQTSQIVSRAGHPRESAEVRLARARAYRRFADELLAEQQSNKVKLLPQRSTGLDEWCRMNERRARR